MMQGIQHFFSGFILLKVPFPLTTGFKHMFQRGIADMSDLEPSYVSSISWYFLLMYGLRSLFQLIMSRPTLEQKESDVLHEKFGYQNAPQPNSKITQDDTGTIQLLKQELEQFELYYHTITSNNNKQSGTDNQPSFDNVEKRLLGKNRYPQKKIDPLTIIEDSHFLLGSTTNNSSSTTKASKKKQ